MRQNLCNCLRRGLMRSISILLFEGSLDRRAFPGLSLPSVGMSIMEKEFCSFALETIKELFNQLHLEQERLFVGCCFTNSLLQS